MKEIRIQGRGGEGGVMQAEILATAFLLEGKYSSTLPMFGFERRGAPVTASVRFNKNVIREKTILCSPNCVILLNYLLMDFPSVFTGLKPGGILIINTPQSIDEAPHPNVRTVGMVDATRIALTEIGRVITNTCMLGAFVATTGWVSLDSVVRSFKQYFEGDILQRNINSAERGFKEVVTKRW